jgi:hypothetical protein
MIKGLLDLIVATGVDGWTILVGILVAGANIPARHFRGHKPVFSKGRCAGDLLNGITLVPFAMMVGAVFSKALLNDLIQSNMVLMAVAGAIGMIFVVGEIMKPETYGARQE